MEVGGLVAAVKSSAWRCWEDARIIPLRYMEDKCAWNLSARGLTVGEVWARAAAGPYQYGRVGQAASMVFKRPQSQVHAYVDLKVSAQPKRGLMRSQPAQA